VNGVAMRKEEQKIPNKFYLDQYICYPSQQPVWERLQRFLASPEEKILALEAPKGGGKSWLLLLLHGLATTSQAPPARLSDSCAQNTSVTRVVEMLHQVYPAAKALLVAGERWKPTIEPAAEPFVLPSQGVLSVDDIENSVARALKHLWGMKTTPLPVQDDARITFKYHLRHRLKEVPEGGFALLLVDAPEALSDDARHVLEDLVLAPYLDAPRGKVLLALRVGALPTWRHSLLQSVPRVPLPGLDEEDLVIFWTSRSRETEAEVPEPLGALLQKLRDCPPRVVALLTKREEKDRSEGEQADKGNGARESEDIAPGLPPLLVDLWSRCDSADDLWTCLRQEWLQHAFRHEWENGYLRLADGEAGKVSKDLWETWLMSLVRTYKEKEQGKKKEDLEQAQEKDKRAQAGFDAWDWEPEGIFEPTFWDRWAVYGVLQRVGLMRFHQGGWWLDPSLCLLFGAAPAEEDQR